MQLLDTQTPLLNTHGITLHVTREQFAALCRDNPELRLELSHHALFQTGSSCRDLRGLVDGNAS